MASFSSIISPMSIAVEKGHFDIVKHILVNSSYIDLSDTGKSPLLLAAENGYHEILVVLLHSIYKIKRKIGHLSPLISPPFSTFCCSFLPSIVLSFSFFISPMTFISSCSLVKIVSSYRSCTLGTQMASFSSPPLLLAAENGYHEILVVLLHSIYNDITKTYLDTTPLEIAV
jgi:ankyrin repeat protein